jgi:hypothetical protein
MEGGVVRIIRESGPLRGSSVVHVTYKTSSVKDEVKLLKADILYLTLYNNNLNGNTGL